MSDSVDKNKILVGGKSSKEQLKEKIKAFIRKQLKEMTTTANVAGYNTPNAFGKVKNPTSSLKGYTVVGEDKSDKTDDKKEKTGHDKPMISTPSQEDKELGVVRKALAIAQSQLDKASKKKRGEKK